MSKFWDNMGNALNRIGDNIKQGWNDSINSIKTFFNPTLGKNGGIMDNAFNENKENMLDVNNAVNTIKSVNNHMTPTEAITNISDSMREFKNTGKITPVKGSLADIINNNPNQEVREPTRLTDEEEKAIKNGGELKGDTVKGEAELNGNTDFNINEMLDKINQQNKDLQKELWQREDKIRAETQKREDTAYQRAVEDARKAGINLNLIGINPANSGGGITQASKMENVSSNEINSAIQMMINSINNNKDISENTKDRNTDILRTIISVGIMAMLR